MKAIKTLGAAVLALAITAPAIAGHHAKQTQNIVETAASAGQFETLIAAAKAAGLAGALTGDGPLTVFAPTDEAFAALPAGTIETLLKPENKSRLAAILKYHVIAGRVGSGALADGATLDTLNGAPATIAAAEEGFTIQGARIVATDIEASNGLVHVIDRVILPPERMGRADALNLIRMTINEGVPMFNHGDHKGTAAMYMATANSLMQRASDELTASEMQRLRYGVKAAGHADSAGEQAWTLRYALDDVSASLSGKQNMMTANVR